MDTNDQVLRNRRAFIVHAPRSERTAESSIGATRDLRCAAQFVQTRPRQPRRSLHGMADRENPEPALRIRSGRATLEPLELQMRDKLSSKDWRPRF